MRNNKSANCPCCPNHCSQDNLKCSKGKNYFSEDKSNSKFSHSHKHCGFGHHKHHGKENFIKHGKPNFESDSISGQLMLAAQKIMHDVHNGNFFETSFLETLSSVEKDELLFLLRKINSKD